MLYKVILRYFHLRNKHVTVSESRVYKKIQLYMYKKYI